MLKDFFIKQAIKEVEIENFIRQNFPLGDYSKTELQRTPLGLRVVIYTNKPGRIIGKGGRIINEMTEAIKNRFQIENPQLEVRSIPHPDLDAKIVAKQIVSALEKGYNHKKIGNLVLERIMNAGAIGAQIIISGKLGGSKSMISKFLGGYIKQCGNPKKELVDDGFEEALTRPGKIGVRVRIMKEFRDITGQLRTKESQESIVEELAKEEEAEATEELAELRPVEEVKKEEKAEEVKKPAKTRKRVAKPGAQAKKTKTNKKPVAKK